MLKLPIFIFSLLATSCSTSTFFNVEGSSNIKILGAPKSTLKVIRVASCIATSAAGGGEVRIT
ncbi:hypothetical protein LguiA_021944 [Lonicera macranthoides]